MIVRKKILKNDSLFQKHAGCMWQPVHVNLMGKIIFGSAYYMKNMHCQK